MEVHVSAPGSSANVGPGFDALGIAVSLPFELASTERPGFHPAEATHPAAVAHRHLGGDGPLWWRSPIPPGRGLGYSGAARVAGAFAALAAEHGPGIADEPVAADARQRAFECAAELEGHPDNAAASAFGGITTAVESHVVGIETPLDAQLVVWWPPDTSSTSKSRTALAEHVPFADAVFNVGRVALLVAALQSGDVAALAAAFDDRLHEASRLATMAASARAYEQLADSEAIGCWLSGSGPTIAALVQRPASEAVASSTPDDGTTRILDIVAHGVRADVRTR